MDRRQFIASLSAFLCAPGMAHAMGEKDQFTIAQLEYPGQWNPRPNALRRLLLEVEKRTSIQVAPTPASVGFEDPKLFEHPFLVLSGDRKFDPLPDKAISTLRSYLLAGGFLFVDSAEGVQDGPFFGSVSRDLGRVFPDKKLVTVPRDQVLYKSFYLIEKPVGRIVADDHMKGIYDDDRLAVVVSQNDMQGAWARDMFGNWTYECTPGGERQRELAYRMGINLVMYALCINYKADQVHVPFILDRRTWRVDE